MQTIKLSSFEDRGLTDHILILTCDFKFQSPASHGTDPCTCKRSRPKVSRSKDRVETDRQTYRGDCITSCTNALGNNATA